MTEGLGKSRIAPTFSKRGYKDLAPAPSSFLQFLYNLKINFLQIVFMGEGFPALFCLTVVVRYGPKSAPLSIP